MIRLGLLVSIIFLQIFHGIGQEISNINPSIKFIGGEAYYIHETLEGQRIEDITQAYASNLEDVFEVNPGLDTTLFPGQKIRIPFTDESVPIMKIISDKQKEEKLKEIRARKSSKKQDPAPEPPIVEAVALIEQEDDQEKQKQEELEALASLSESIEKSLADLQRVSDQIDQTPVAESDGLPGKEPSLKSLTIQPKGMAASSLLDSLRESYLDLDERDDTSLVVREYFLVRLNRDGIITNVRDERTETNQNTYVLNPESLKGMNLSKEDSLTEYQNVIVALGLNAQFSQYHYHLKVKPGKIKSLRSKYGGDDVLENEQHLEAIRTKVDHDILKGKYLFIIDDGYSYVSLHDQFEYNPFAISRMELDEVAVFAIVEIRSL